MNGIACVRGMNEDCLGSEIPRISPPSCEWRRASGEGADIYDPRHCSDLYPAFQRDHLVEMGVLGFGSFLWDRRVRLAS